MTLFSKALAAQLIGGLGALFVSRFVLPPQNDPLLITALIQGAIAALAGSALHLPRWWLPIQLFFFPLAVLALRLNLPPWLWLAGFAALLLIFWRTDSSRVPLYLSNATTAAAVAQLIPPGRGSVLDIGCGSGSLLCRLARARPECHFVGIEHAPLTWLFAWLRSRSFKNVEIRRGDFWRTDLSSYGMIYAFLSPVPMPRLWNKARQEVPADTLLVSNSFEIPGVTPERVIDVDDRRQTRLFCYLPGKK